MHEVRRLLPESGVVSDTASPERPKERGFEQSMVRTWLMSFEAINAKITASKIKGRGGAGFPTGLKRMSVLKVLGQTKYVVMNADESELGTFKDRALLEADPFAALVGLLILAHTVGARKAYGYIRGEYRDVARIMGDALATLRQRG